jgi:hypothetical protein
MLTGQTWRATRSITGAALLAARTPGVYAIGKVHRHHGLPLRAEWAYVGRTDSLRRRLLEHEPTVEANPGLRGWLRRNRDKLEVWLLAADGSISRRLEKALIQEIQPLFNRIRYQERK